MSAGKLTLGQIAEWSGGRVVGDPDHPVRGMATLQDAAPSDLALLAAPGYLDAVPASQAGALLVAEELESRIESDPRPRIIVSDPRDAMIPILERLDPTPRYPAGIHPTAVIEEGVQLGEEVSVGPYAVLEAGAQIGDRTRIGSHCVVGRDCTLGADVYLHPHVVLYANTVLGARVIVHSGARVGSDGFGYSFVDGRLRKIPQVGACTIGDDVEIGANSCVDRGSIGQTTIEEGVKLDNLVQIGHNVTLGKHGGYAAMSGVGGSTRVGPYAQFGGQAGAVGHLELPARLSVGAGSKIVKSMGKEGDTVMGYPAVDQRDAGRIWASWNRLPDLLKRVRRLEQASAGANTDSSGDEDE